jgi:hypothetical protein
VEVKYPLEVRIKLVIDNLKAAQAVYENLGYIQGYIESARVHSPKMISEDYLREMERENLLKAGLKGLEPRSEWELEREKKNIQECIKIMAEISPEDNETIIITEDAEIIVSDEVKESIQKGNWKRYKESVYKYTCSCCSAEITGPIILILTSEKVPLCESCFERLHKQIKGDYMKEEEIPELVKEQMAQQDALHRKYWEDIEREKAESMEVKEEDGNK